MAHRISSAARVRRSLPWICAGRLKICMLAAAIGTAWALPAPIAAQERDPPGAQQPEEPEPEPAAPASEQVFSGPQQGESLTGFQVQGVYDSLAGQSFDPLADADGRTAAAPHLLVFVHPPLTRPAAGVTRVLTKYAASLKDQGLVTHIVWLTDDASEAEHYLTSARQSLSFEVPLGIFKDGVEGPGSYGLNRQVSLTILLARDGRVVQNWAYVQPSLTEVTSIAVKVAELVGAPAPTQEDLLPRGQGWQPLMREFLAKDASPQEVEKRAARMEALMQQDATAYKEITAACKRVVDSGRLDQYGTPTAQAFIRTWADKATP